MTCHLQLEDTKKDRYSIINPEKKNKRQSGKEEEATTLTNLYTNINKQKKDRCTLLDLYRIIIKKVILGMLFRRGNLDMS